VTWCDANHAPAAPGKAPGHGVSLATASVGEPQDQVGRGLRTRWGEVREVAPLGANWERICAEARLVKLCHPGRRRSVRINTVGLPVVDGPPTVEQTRLLAGPARRGWLDLVGRPR
jgi:hypothetical protein